MASASLDLDRVIVGGGPHGVHAAVMLQAEGHVRPARLAIVDPAPRLLDRWTRFTASTGMGFLRSPAVHHLGVSPFALVQFAGRKKRDRKRQGRFTRPYNRPSLDFFQRHCAAVVSTHGLSARHRQDRVERLDPGPDAVRVHLASGETWRVGQVVLALGNSDHPRWPEAARGLREAGGRVCHVFGDDAPLDPAGLPSNVAILGGGISAAQVALRLANTGRRVTVVARHQPRQRQFDSDPGWIGPRYLREFWAISDYAHRRAILDEARHRGSMPPDVRCRLRAAVDRGDIQWRVAALAGGAVQPDGALRLDLTEGPPLPVGALVLATGFSSSRPGGALVQQLVDDHRLPVAPCGYPQVGPDLRWHPRIAVMGPLAELELGPTARNLVGARSAAERLVGRAPAGCMRQRLAG